MRDVTTYTERTVEQHGHDDIQEQDVANKDVGDEEQRNARLGHKPPRRVLHEEDTSEGNVACVTA